MKTSTLPTLFFFLNQEALKHIVLPLCPKQDQEMAFHAAPISHYEMSVMSRPAFHLLVVTKLSLGWNFCGQAWPWEDRALGGWKPLSLLDPWGLTRRAANHCAHLLDREKGDLVWLWLCRVLPSAASWC